MKTPYTGKKIYISGPMRGHEDFNFPAFFAAEEYLTEQGAALTFNPARRDSDAYRLSGYSPHEAGLWLREHGMFGGEDIAPLRHALAADMEFICHKADMVFALPGWERSKGATAEVHTALALGLPVMEHLSALEPEEDKAMAEYESALAEVSEHEQNGSGEEPMFTAEQYRALAEADPVMQEFMAEAFMGGNRHPQDEVRVTSGTGGQKGAKGAAFDQVSPEVERLIAEHFGKGARKYEAHNFRRGYPWSLSYSALRRHLADFWEGNEYDTCPPTREGCAEPYNDDRTCFNHTGSLHIVAVCWHAMVLTEFFLHHPDYDDRFRYGPTEGRFG